MRSATPKQSKPGPRFEVLAGTRTVTCCIRRWSVATPSFSGNRSVRPCRIESMPVDTADENESWVELSKLVSRLPSRGNRPAPALHHGGGLGETLRTRHSHLIQASPGSRAAHSGIEGVGKRYPFQV